MGRQLPNTTSPSQQIVQIVRAGKRWHTLVVATTRAAGGGGGAVKLG